MFKHLDAKMTQEKYYDMCDQLDIEPNPAEIPPSIHDFPPLMQDAVNTFNMLGDRIFPDIGYVGKDYTNLDTYIELYGVEEPEMDFFLQVLAWLDSRAITKSSERMKKEHEKLKRSSSGK